MRPGFNALFGVGLAGALLLAGVGTLRQVPPGREDPPVRLRVIDVEGFSWERVIRLRKAGSLPFLDGLFARGGAFGDIVSDNFPGDFAITASICTGRWPSKHGITGPGGERTAHRRFALPVWEHLARSGQSCAVIGFPATADWGPREGVLYIDSPTGERPRPDDAAAPLTLVRGGTPLPPGTARLLEECLAGDTNRAAAAAGLLESPEAPRHIFLRLEGLERWRRALEGGTVETALPADDLIDGYYRRLDSLLSFLGPDKEGETLFLLSSRGSGQKPPSYRPYFPRLDHYPALGFLYVSGSRVRIEGLPLTVYPVDIAPTLLYLSGNPVLNNMDGRIIFGLLEESLYFENQPLYR